MVSSGRRAVQSGHVQAKHLGADLFPASCVLHPLHSLFNSSDVVEQ